MKVELERLAEAAALGDAAAWQALWAEIEPIVWGITGKWQITGPLMCLPFCNKVVVAGVNLGSTPIVRRRLDPGRHNVELWRGDKRSVRTVHVRAGKTSTLTHRAPRATSCNPPYTIDKSGLKRMKAECLEPTPAHGRPLGASRDEGRAQGESRRGHRFETTAGHAPRPVSATWRPLLHELAARRGAFVLALKSAAK